MKEYYVWQGESAENLRRQIDISTKKWVAFLTQEEELRNSKFSCFFLSQLSPTSFLSLYIPSNLMMFLRTKRSIHWDRFKVVHSNKKWHKKIFCHWIIHFTFEASVAITYYTCSTLTCIKNFDYNYSMSLWDPEQDTHWQWPFFSLYKMQTNLSQSETLYLYCMLCMYYEHWLCRCLLLKECDHPIRFC